MDECLSVTVLWYSILVFFVFIANSAKNITAKIYEFYSMENVKILKKPADLNPN